MNIAEIFIRRPIMTSLVMFAIFIFGISAYRLLPASDLPNVDFPTIQVTASLPGANPDTMAMGTLPIALGLGAGRSASPLSAVLWSPNY